MNNSDSMFDDTFLISQEKGFAPMLINIIKS